MKQKKREVAETLRKQGESIKEIAKVLEVSVSTVSRWCKKITLSSKQRKHLDEKRREAGIAALAPWIQLHREEKAKDIVMQKRKGKEDVGKVTSRELFFFGLGLYSGEGYKRGSQECGFTNADPEVIRTILAWFEQCYGIGKERVSARVTINLRHKERSQEIMQDWSKETGIPISNFSNPTFITGYGAFQGDDRTYRGTLRIKIRNGTSLRRRILAGISVANTQISPNSLKTAS